VAKLARRAHDEAVHPPSENENTGVISTESFVGAFIDGAAGEVRPGRHDRMLYATDASLYQVEPLGVVIPRNQADLREAVRRCARGRIPILPRGGGTSLAGQAVNRAAVLDCSPSLREIGPVDESSRTVSVEPGVVLDELNETLARRGHGLFFGPDVATSRHATLGGMIGNNSAGSRSVRYGMTADHVAALDVVLIGADGETREARFDAGAATGDNHVRALTEEVIRFVDSVAEHVRARYPKIVRRADGYALDRLLSQIYEARARGADPVETINLAPLLVGSEGTLAVTTRATLSLVPTPAARRLAVCAFTSMDEAIEAVNPILTTDPSAVELLDDLVMSLAKVNPEQRRNVELMPPIDGRPPDAVLYVEYATEGDGAELDAPIRQLREIVPPDRVRLFHTPEEMTRAWALRKAGEPLLHGLPGLRKPLTFVEDTAVDPKRLPEFVRRFRALVEAHGTRAAFYAHASVGCLHIRPLLDIHDAGDRDLMRRIAQEVADLVVEFGGALTGEHGDGRVRSPLLERYFGPEIMDAFRRIKGLFDPLNLCNPGNLVGPANVETITASLRVLPERESVTAPEIQTYFDYSDQHGFNGAIEQCNGAGVCRKKQGGTMCPSYMATLDERHSTRGRGNALRLAITGQLTRDGAARWDDPETLKTLDWCLSCKACKAECPSNVDVARLKSEYLAQRNSARGRVPLRDRLIANIRTINRLGAMAPAVGNFVAQLEATKALAQRFFSIDARRSLPPVSRPLSGMIRPVLRRTAGRERTVAVFADCFTGWSEPGAGVATARLLEALGYRVELVSPGCCGRPAISVGALDIAKKQIERTVEELAPYASDDACEAILICEPSCLSATIDDWRALRLDADPTIIEQLAEKSRLPEQFVEERWDDHPKPIRAMSSDRRAVLHAHCHQKALLGDDSSAALLRRLVGDNLEVLDAGCCGMAGAFGFDTGRFDLSEAIGERVLLPAVRRAAPTTPVCAPGASCRHQIRDGADRHAIHPIELAAELLMGKD